MEEALPGGGGGGGVVVIVTGDLPEMEVSATLVAVTLKLPVALPAV
jgi:hypothetical protein